MILLAGALLLTVWHNGVMGPRMADDIQTYRMAAEADDRASAEAAMASFDVDHKTAERLFGLRWCLLIGAVAGFAGGQRRAPERNGGPIMTGEGHVVPVGGPTKQTRGFDLPEKAPDETHTSESDSRRP